MAKVIKHNRSTPPGAAPVSNQLAEGELAINVADGVLFVKNSAAAIVGFPNLPLSATQGELLAWNGTNWAAVSIWALLSGDGNDSVSYIDGGSASSAGAGVLDGNCC